MDLTWQVKILRIAAAIIILTQAELDLAISEIIVAQEKPRSTQNSHRRKQWENRRNWRLCTVSESCKLGVVKNCSHKKNYNYFAPPCENCCGQFGLSSFGRLGGVYTLDCNSRYKKFSYNCKILRDYLNRYVRYFKGEIGNYGYYRKMFDYLWGCV